MPPENETLCQQKSCGMQTFEFVKLQSMYEMKWEKLLLRVCFQDSERRLQTHSNVLALVALLRLRGILSPLLFTLGHT